MTQNISTHPRSGCRCSRGVESVYTLINIIYFIRVFFAFSIDPQHHRRCRGCVNILRVFLSFLAAHSAMYGLSNGRGAQNRSKRHDIATEVSNADHTTWGDGQKDTQLTCVSDSSKPPRNRHGRLGGEFLYLLGIPFGQPLI